MHQKDESPCQLAASLYNVDVLMTPHGFQSMLLLFLPRPAIIFEVNKSIRNHCNALNVFLFF